MIKIWHNTLLTFLFSNVKMKLTFSKYEIKYHLKCHPAANNDCHIMLECFVKKFCLNSKKNGNSWKDRNLHYCHLLKFPRM